MKSFAFEQTSKNIYEKYDMGPKFDFESLSKIHLSDLFDAQDDFYSPNLYPSFDFKGDLEIVKNENVKIDNWIKNERNNIDFVDTAAASTVAIKAQDLLPKEEDKSQNSNHELTKSENICNFPRLEPENERFYKFK